jgi:hypothetical protein
MGHTMSKDRYPWTWLFIAVVILPFISYFVFWISLYAFGELLNGWIPAWFGDSSRAEIIVLAPDDSPEGFRPELITVSSAADYPSTHPGATFVIPRDRQNQVEERLKINLNLSWTTFEIKRLSDSQEQITWYYIYQESGDSSGSRYIASKDRVQLQSYRMEGDGGATGIGLLAWLVTLAVNVVVLGYFVLRAISLRRKNLRFRNATH